MMAGNFSISTRVEGYDQEYSLYEFKNYLNVDFSLKECNGGWVFWRPEKPECELENGIIPFDDLLISSSNFSRTEIEDKIKCLLEEITSNSWKKPFLVQFWAPEVVDQRLYLTTAHHPFAVGLLCKGLCMYRQRCMYHRFRVDGGAAEEELGAVGRVFRNKRPESTPDLRLYSADEFPLRDYAACYGLRSFVALPIFDLQKEKCYGVLEVLYFDSEEKNAYYLEQGLKAAQLRTTHLNFRKYAPLRDADSEITKMLELAIMVIPPLQMAQVWVPCHECSYTSNSLSCMERVAFISAGQQIVNSWNTCDSDFYNYHLACQLHTLQIGKRTNMIAAVMSSENKSIFCPNICDFSISENPLAHYAQKAGLSSCFTICLHSSHISRDIYVVEFFLQCNSIEDAASGSFLPLLIRIMEMELKNFMFAYKGQSGEELVVGFLKENMLISGESGQSNALRYESIKYKHQHSKEHSMSMVMEGCKKTYPAKSDFKKYLQEADLNDLEPYRRITNAWTFWSGAGKGLSENEVDFNSSLLPDLIQEKIKCILSKITSEWDWDSYALAQFWAPKVDADRCYLETSGQPFALGCLYKGLAFFRKECMEHRYFVDDGAKEEELGPPGRVFLNGHPEITADLRLYSPTEFPLRNHAANCCLREYFALPVFDMNGHKCVGVLELVGFSISSLQVIEDALKVSNLSPTHVYLKPSLQNAECRQLALVEIQEACNLFAEIPQLYMVEVWVPYSKCPSINDNLSCMERVWATKDDWKLDPLTCQVQQVESGKGIAGMALASENTSCFCQNLCEFRVAERSLAYHARCARLNVCFAICLRSWHTGDLLYLLEFYLNQDPGNFKYLRSFLCFLLTIMKQKLKSFNVASGPQFGEKLVVEVIRFSEVKELAFSELDQLDIYPITFKFVKYGGRKHCKDNQVQCAPDGLESVRNVAQAKHCISSIAAANLKQKETEGRKTKTHLSVNLEDLEPYDEQKLDDVAKELDVSKPTMKRRRGDYDIQICRSNENCKKNYSLFVKEGANKSARDSQQNMDLSSYSNLPPSDMPLHQYVAHANHESSQSLVIQPKVDMVIVYAKYESKTIKFKLCHSAGIENLVKEVATRLKLVVGSFELEYLDEVINEKILLTCDADLELCLESLTPAGKPPYIQVFVQSI